VAKHGDDDTRENVTATLRQSVQIAQDRSHASATPNGAAAISTKRRQVYDARHKRTLPGKLVLDDFSTGSSDIEANEAFDGAGATYDFYAKAFLRNSIDDKGMPLISTIHYGAKFDNAMWDGTQMIYGDGDGKLFNRFTIALDVIAHELTHGVTQNTAKLAYAGQSGALNEHLSDAFGIMAKQYALGQIASQSDWLIGAGLLGPNVRGKAIRSMKAPGTAYDDPSLGRDPQPAHMRGYVTSPDDNGGVHINSGIPNHAFYLAATAIGGQPWMVLGRIWYRVLTVKLFPHAGFQDFANATVFTAGELFGKGSSVQAMIAEAWSQVGLPVPLVLGRPKPPKAQPRTAKWRNRPAPRARA
jgi:Zn-dependent metalloprotease